MASDYQEGKDRHHVLTRSHPNLVDIFGLEGHGYHYASGFT